MYLELRPLKRKLRFFKQSHKGGIGSNKTYKRKRHQECVCMQKETREGTASASQRKEASGEITAANTLILYFLNPGEITGNIHYCSLFSQSVFFAMAS